MLYNHFTNKIVIMADHRKRDNPNPITLCGTLYVDMSIKKNSFTYCETHKTVNTRNIYEEQEN